MTPTSPPQIASQTAALCPACHHPWFRSLGPIRYGVNALVADRDASQLVESLGRVELVECASCGFRWTDPQYSMEPIIELYKQNDQTHWEAEGRDWNRYVSDLRPYLKPGGRVLDIGCYAGDFLHCLGPEFERHGIEPIPFAADVARQRGIQVHEGTQDTAPYTPGTFDLITLWDVAEHLQNPRETFAEIAAWLKPDGYLALETGNVECWLSRYMASDWWYVSFLEHCSFYSVASLERIFEHSGLTLKSCTRTQHHRMSTAKTLVQFMKCGLYRSVSLASERRGRVPSPLTRLLRKHPPCALIKDHLFAVAQRVS